MTRLKTLTAALCAAGAIGAAQAHSRVFIMDGYDASLSFSSEIMGLSSIEGGFTRFIAVISVDDDAPEDARAIVRVDANSLTAAEAGWVDDLKGPDFFDVEAYPEFGFVSRTATVEGPGELRLDGVLTLRGQSRPVSMRVRYDLPASPGDTARIEADGEIDRTDFGMAAYELVVADEVTIEVSGVARPAYAEAATALTATP